jgi:hypothetical protein
MNQKHFNKMVAFGAALIETQDLDPVYVAIAGAELPRAQVKRLLLAYSCLYHLGAAAYISNFTAEDFWQELYKAAVNKDLLWPRGSERRHWRGKASVNCVEWLRDKFAQPEDAIKFWSRKLDHFYFGLDCRPVTGVAPTCDQVMYNVQQFPLYGPWIAFKVADLLERVLKVPVDFSQFELGVYSEPRKGAALALTGDTEAKITDRELNQVVMALLRSPLGRMKAPPGRDRSINVQEIETVLCKYKSHCGGHYELGKDTKEIAHGLSDPRWGASKLKRAVEPLMEQWR